MKILLNLLPDDKKLENQRALHGRFLLWQLFLLFLLEVFLLSIFVAVYFILDYQLKTVQNIEQSQGSVTAGQQALVEKYESKFRGINEALDVVGRLDGSHFYFTQIFRLLDREMPEGVLLRDIVTKDRTVTMSGSAETRELLLDFEGRLKASACVEKVEVPLSNLFSERNVDFQIDFVIKLECLRQNSL